MKRLFAASTLIWASLTAAHALQPAGRPASPALPAVPALALF